MRLKLDSDVCATVEYVCATDKIVNAIHSFIHVSKIIHQLQLLSDVMDNTQQF
jgi:hypothetical protein